MTFRKKECFSDELLNEARQEENNIEPAYDIVIPGHVLNIPRNLLSGNAKNLYGIIRGLTRRKGYCWATNEFLAKQLGCDPRSIQRHLKQLKTCEVIEVQEFTDGFSNRRRIWLSEEFKKFLLTTKLSPHHDRVVTLPRQSCRTEYNNRNIIIENKDIAQPAAPLRKEVPEISFSFETREFKNISQEDIKSWKEIFPAVNFDIELKKMIRWCIDNTTKSKSKKKWGDFITKWLRRANEEAINKEAYQSRSQYSNNTNKNSAEVDRILTQQIAKRFPSKIDDSIIIGPTYLEFKFGIHAYNLKFGESGFRERALNYLRKMDLPINEF